MSNHLSASEAATKERILASKQQNNASGKEEEEESVFWKRVGLQMVPVCARKACEVGLKRIPIERGDPGESVGLRSSQRIQQLKMAT